MTPPKIQAIPQHPGDSDITTHHPQRITTRLLAEALSRNGLLVWADPLPQGFKVSKPADASPPDRRLLLTTSSKACGPDSCFIMFKGTRTDSHDFAADAFLRGCRVFIGDHEARMGEIKKNLSALPQENLSTNFELFCVTNARAAWAVLEAQANGNPQQHLKFAAVTGTNGKTSTVWLLKGLLDQIALAAPPGPGRLAPALAPSMLSIGTLGMYFKNQFVPTTHTSPDPDFLYPALAHALSTEANRCGMEVSSHSLAQEKIWPICFDFAAFTSFSRDHLDFHGTEANYFATKVKLFQKQLSNQARIALHQSVAGRVQQSLATMPGDSWVYGMDLPAQSWPGWNQIAATTVGESPQGTAIELVVRPLDGAELKFQGTIPVFGDVFVENFMAAFLAAHKLAGLWPEAALWSQLKPVPGRMELVAAPQKADEKALVLTPPPIPLVFVDYAHTPDALSQVLGFAKKIADSRKSNLWCVFGCGGDRDRGKRPLMAAACSALANTVVVTSDNPRSENPEHILDEIVAGFAEDYRLLNVHRVCDRQAAIAYAVSNASSLDVIVIAGKGHETYQEIAGKKLPFDDRIFAQNALGKLKAPPK